MRYGHFVLVGALILALAMVGTRYLAPDGADALPAAQTTGSFHREYLFATDNAVSADEQSEAFAGFSAADMLAVKIACTEDSGTATLDVAVQHTMDQGATWDDLFTFAQLAATGSEIVGIVEAYGSDDVITDSVRIDYDITGTGAYTCDVSGVAEG